MTTRDTGAADGGRGHSPLPWKTTLGARDFILDRDANVIVCLPSHAPGSMLGAKAITLPRDANAHLIVDAVNSNPALVAENAALRARAERAEAALETVSAAAKGVLTHPRRAIIYSLWDDALDDYVCVQCANAYDEGHTSRCAYHVLLEALAAAAGEVVADE